MNGGKGRHKKKCAFRMKVNRAEFTLKNYGFRIDACGLRQTGVSCMDHIPEKKEGD